MKNGREVIWLRWVSCSNQKSFHLVQIASLIAFCQTNKMRWSFKQFRSLWCYVFNYKFIVLMKYTCMYTIIYSMTSVSLQSAFLKLKTNYLRFSSILHVSSSYLMQPCLGKSHKRWQTPSYLPIKFLLTRILVRPGTGLLGGFVLFFHKSRQLQAV